MTGRNVLTLVTAVVLAVGMLPAQWGHAVPTTGLMVHLDASAIDSGDPNQVSGGLVKSWRDSYTGDGFNDNADQTDPSNQPMYNASVAAINNKPAVEFVGAGTTVHNHLQIANRLALDPDGGGYTVLMVTKLDDLTVNNVFLTKGNNNKSDDMLYLYQNSPRSDRENDANECFPGTGRPAAFNSWADDAGVKRAQIRTQANTDWNILTSVYTGNSIEAYINGDANAFYCLDNTYEPNTWTTNDPNANDLNGQDIRIGNNYVKGGNSSLDGLIAEVLIYDSDLDAAGLRLMVEQELGTKYGINVVPEPTTWLLLILGAVGMAPWRFRRRA